jgi:DNA-binding NtrC family response regulator
MNKNRESLNVLLVDDEIDFLKAASKALARRGFSVTTAENGYEALRSIELEKPDVVILDIRMPGIDGEHIFVQMKKGRPDVPVIILTGHGDPAQAFRTMKLGVADYVTKPCDMDLLAEKISKVTSCYQRPQSTPTVETATKIRLLLVDDEEELLESLSRVLTRRGMIVIKAASGSEALEVLQRQRVDVAVVDIKMPGMDGLELTRHLKRLYPALEVVILTGHPSTDSAFLSTKLGVYKYVVKPPDIEMLSSAIWESLEEKERKREAQQLEEVRKTLNQNPDY